MLIKPFNGVRHELSALASRRIFIEIGNEDQKTALSVEGDPSIIHVKHAKLDPDKNLIELSRKNPALKKLLIDLANSGFYLGKFKNGTSTFINNQIIKTIWKRSRDKSMELMDDMFFTVQKPNVDVAPYKMLVVFSSVGNPMYSTSLNNRNFFVNFPSIAKYVPANTLLLRMSDIGSVVGSFYLNNNFSSNVEKNTRATIEHVARRHNIDKNDIVLYGASKGGTAALYHGILAGIKTVAVEPIVSDDHYIKSYNDSHFTVGSFPVTKQEKFLELMKTTPIHGPVKIIYSSMSPQHKYITEIIKENDKYGKISFYNSVHPNIKNHPDVGPNSVNLLVTLINGLFYNILDHKVENGKII